MLDCGMVTSLPSPLSWAEQSRVLLRAFWAPRVLAVCEASSRRRTPEQETPVPKTPDDCPQAPTPTSVCSPSSSQAPRDAKQLPCNSRIRGEPFFSSQRQTKDMLSDLLVHPSATPCGFGVPGAGQVWIPGSRGLPRPLFLAGGQRG